ncbi:glutathione S-transferase family protein [Novosphingobium sp. NDB2Meth1]|uniref:glutathione S-transferase family protein n=1 Tax=Novosphingobium sp. NDB2Meth1 TaxID=1892847 RepID=UPI000930BE96|nr:glutathione S-transferase family protein [Novosphingobium sp. NDB2Meth1]
MADASTLKVYHLPGAWGLPTVSPFCLKLDAWLRMTGIPHESITAPTPFAGPKGKAPWIELDGKKLGDSTFIVAHLAARFGVDPDAHLTPAQHGMAVAIQRLIDENLYWTMVHDRWMNDANWKQFRDVVLSGVAAPLRRVLGPIARRGVKKQLEGHGIGIHEPEEIAAIGRRDVNALAAILGDQDWFFGDTPSTIDAVAYAQLVNIWRAPFESEVRRAIGQTPNLVAFIDRFAAKYYS